MDQPYPLFCNFFSSCSGFSVESRVELCSTEVLESGVVLLMQATLPSRWSGLALWLLESRCYACGCPGGSRCPSMRQTAQGTWSTYVYGWCGLCGCVLINEDLRAVDALQLSLLGELGVVGEHVLLQPPFLAIVSLQSTSARKLLPVSQQRETGNSSLFQEFSKRGVSRVLWQSTLSYV